MSLPTPNTRKEQYLNAIATGNTVDMPAKPITREEAYLDAIAKNGGGSGDGDMKKSVYDSDSAVSNAGGIGAFVSDAISGKVDKEAGKGLSTNDYSDTEKGKVTANAEAIEAMVNVNGCCNILPPNYDQSIGNISYTLNSDKSAIVTANVPDAEGNYALLRVASVTLKAGSYVLSGCPSGGSNSTYCLLLASPGLDNRFDIGEDLEFTATEGQEFIIWIYVGRGLSWTKTFYPMLYDARLNPTGYVPYAMTNRELTERIKVVSIPVTSITIAAGSSYMLYNNPCPTGYTPVSASFIRGAMSNDSILLTTYLDNGTDIRVHMYNFSNSSIDLNGSVAVLCIKS